MDITKFELNIKSVSDVKKGRIPPGFYKSTDRRSDCFVYVLTGEAEYFFADNAYTAKAGSVIYLSYHSNYSIKVTDENYTYVFVDFYFENENDTVFENMICSSKSMLLLNSCFEKMHNLWRFGDFSDKIYCKALVCEVYAKVVKQRFSEYISPAKKQQLENIVEYIYSNVDNSELSISMLSKMLNVSEVHFRRLFSHTYHTSPIDFITSTRINRAKELLENQGFSISHVAEMCGFHNHYYFSKVFKNRTNMTPSEYRKQYKINI